MKFDSGNFGGGENKEGLTEVRRAERERVVDMYIKHLGLRGDDLMGGKKILDVGAGRLASFGDGTRVRKYDCEVVSVDRDDFIDVGEDKIDQGKNRKIGGVDFENLKLAGKGGFKDEPEFDLILSNSGPPYTVVNTGENVVETKNGEKREDVELLRGKIKGIINSAAKHLKVHGRAVFYPIFQAEVVDFGEGGRGDYRNWRKILDEVLMEELSADPERGYSSHVENVKTERGHAYQRLIIVRKF